MPEAINTEIVLLGRQADAIDDAERSRSEIRALLDSRSEAVRIKDIDRLMSLYFSRRCLFRRCTRSPIHRICCVDG